MARNALRVLGRKAKKGVRKGTRLGRNKINRKKAVISNKGRETVGRTGPTQTSPRTDSTITPEQRNIESMFDDVGAANDSGLSYRVNPKARVNDKQIPLKRGGEYGGPSELRPHGDTAEDVLRVQDKINNHQRATQLGQDDYQRISQNIGDQIGAPDISGSEYGTGFGGISSRYTTGGRNYSGVSPDPDIVQQAKRKAGRSRGERFRVKRTTDSFDDIESFRAATGNENATVSNMSGHNRRVRNTERISDQAPLSEQQRYLNEEGFGVSHHGENSQGIQKFHNAVGKENYIRRGADNFGDTMTGHNIPGKAAAGVGAIFVGQSVLGTLGQQSNADLYGQ